VPGLPHVWNVEGCEEVADEITPGTCGHRGISLVLDPLLRHRRAAGENHIEARAAVRAEALGYDSVWVADGQMLCSDCCAVLALATRPAEWRR
jgi:hypothetical protein